jgi:type IV pilus assembly protein PilO
MAAAKESALAKLPLAGKIGVGAFFAAAVFGIYYLIFYSDLASTITKEKARTDELDSERNKLRQAQTTYFADRDELSMRQQRQREFNKILPETTEAASFLSAIQQVSNVAGVNLNAWQPMEEQKQNFFAKVPMKLEFSGKFLQVAKFVYEIGRVDRIINIENIELSDPKLTGDEVVLKAKCLATTFRLVKKETPKPAAGAPGAAPTAGATGTAAPTPAPTGEKK